MLEASDIRDAVIALVRCIGAIIASAVYLGGVMAWALVAQSKTTMIIAVGAAGLTYLGYLFQIMAGYPAVARASVIGSIVLGAAAGISAFVFH